MTDIQEDSKGPESAEAPITSKQSVRKVLLQRIAQWFLLAPIRLLMIPYLVGILWHCAHPMASVLTGDMNNPRRWYIDENSLDPNHFQMYATYDMIWPSKSNTRKKNNPSNGMDSLITSLCQGIQHYDFSAKTPCFQYESKDNSGGNFEVAMIVPSTAGIVPINEAIVLVVPPILPFALDDPLADHNRKVERSRAQFQASIFQLIQRLSSPLVAPWLSKTLLIVAPLLFGIHDNDTVILPSEDTVQSFLNVYLGSKDRSPSHQGENSSLLPPEFWGRILLQVLVLDLELFTSEANRQADTVTPLESIDMNEIRILPQGRRGVLPNMDLVFLAKVIMERSSMLGMQQLSSKNPKTYQMVDIFMHPYLKHIESVMALLSERSEPYHSFPVMESLLHWFRQLLHLLSFESILALGPYPPHTPALDRGIDALTIQGYFETASESATQTNAPRSKLSPQQYPMELVQRMELMIRSLSNLHERLHHSTSLYLLTSKDRFVKHEEYMIPNFLLIIPLILRPLIYVFQHKKDTKVSNRATVIAVIQALLVTTFWTALASWFLDITSSPHSLFGIWHGYFMAILYIIFLSLIFVFGKETLQCPESRRGIQFASCLLATFLHVSIAFGHVSLAYPSALFWSPLLAFPTYRDVNSSNVRLLVIVNQVYKLVLMFGTSPFVFLVPYIFPTYTPYVRYICVPLHMLFCIQHVFPSFL
jgi:GPI-anchor transamidase subunit GAA1